MSVDRGFRLHPKAAQDITGIWEYIAEDNPLAAGRVREQILAAIRGLVPFPHAVAQAPRSEFPALAVPHCQRVPHRLCPG